MHGALLHRITAPLHARGKSPVERIDRALLLRLAIFLGGALIAPRPLLIETGNEDLLNGYRGRGLLNVTEQLDITSRAYKLLGVEDKLEHDIFDGDHMWHGAAAYDFMKRWL